MRTRAAVAAVVGSIVLLAGLNALAAENRIALTSAFDVSLYGYIKLDASYDTQRTQAGDLMFFVLPEVDGESDSEFNMTAKETRIGLDIGGPASDVLKTMGKIEGDFYGPGGTANSPNFRLRLAYVDLALPEHNLSFRLGQDWETFITVVPRTINFAYLADVGALGLRRPQARVTKVFGAGDTKLVAKIAAARTIGEDIDGGGQDDGADAALPTLQYNLALQTPLLSSRPTVLGVSGHFGRETVDVVSTSVPPRIVDADGADYDTWSVIGSLVLPLTEKLALQGTIWVGENLDTYYGGVGQGINKIMQTEIAAKGGFAQLLFDVTPKVNLNVGYGIDDPDDEDLNAGNRSKNEMIFSSLFYRLTPAATLAFEYSHMTTSYLQADEASNNRFQGAAIYRF